MIHHVPVKEGNKIIPDRIKVSVAMAFGRVELSIYARERKEERKRTMTGRQSRIECNDSGSAIPKTAGVSTQREVPGQLNRRAEK